VRDWKRTLLLLFFILVIVPTIVLADLGKLPGFLAAIYAFPDGDKAGHFVLYGILAFLLVNAAPFSDSQKPWKSSLLYCCLLVVAIGIEEISQHMLQTRSADLLDFICSVLGVVVFGCIAWQVKRKKISTQPDG